MKAELLAPSGDLEAVRTALKYGADAVYCGGPFMQLRAESAGFSEEKLAEAVSLVHGSNKKIYVTVNSFAYNDDIPRMGAYAKMLKSLGVDAVIVSDPGAICEIHEKCPDLEIHLSTQANCMNYRAARMYYDLGVKRIVLARELTIPQIAEMRGKLPDDLELEAFVHGAMCMSYSGRCLMSAFMTGRSGNRGDCAQSCRWNYYLVEEKRPGEYFKVEQDERGSAILSSKELCCIDILQQLEDAGVVSFKIEGRMKTPYYVGTVVNAYRLVMDGKASPQEARRELDTTSHRPFCTGFYTGDPSESAPDPSGYVRDWMFIATADGASAGGELKITTRNPFAVGDEVEVLTPGCAGRAFKIEKIITDEGISIDRSPTPMRTMIINAPDGIEPGDIIRKKN